jgi:hypothetical protein
MHFNSYIEKTFKVQTFKFLNFKSYKIVLGVDEYKWAKILLNTSTFL